MIMTQNDEGLIQINTSINPRNSVLLSDTRAQRLHLQS
jgi:hypothetical protein